MEAKFCVVVLIVACAHVASSATTNQQLSQLFFSAKQELQDGVTTEAVRQQREILNGLLAKQDVDPRLAKLGESLDLTLKRRLGIVEYQDYFALHAGVMPTSYTLPIDEAQRDYVQFVANTGQGTSGILELADLSEKRSFKTYFTTPHGLSQAALVTSRLKDTTTTKKLLRKGLFLSGEASSPKHLSSVEFAKRLVRVHADEVGTLDFYPETGILIHEELLGDVLLIIEKCPVESLLFDDKWWNLLLALNEQQISKIKHHWTQGIRNWGEQSNFDVSPITSAIDRLLDLSTCGETQVNGECESVVNACAEDAMLLCSLLENLELPAATAPELIENAEDVYYWTTLHVLGQLTKQMAVTNVYPLTDAKFFQWYDGLERLSRKVQRYPDLMAVTTNAKQFLQADLQK